MMKCGDACGKEATHFKIIAGMNHMTEMQIEINNCTLSNLSSHKQKNITTGWIKTHCLLSVGTIVIFRRTCNNLKKNLPSGANFSKAHLSADLQFLFPLTATATVETEGTVDKCSSPTSQASISSLPPPAPMLNDLSSL